MGAHACKYIHTHTYTQTHIHTHTPVTKSSLSSVQSLSCVQIFATPWTAAQRRQWHPHSSTLAWKIPWMEAPGGLQPMGSLRVGHDWATSLSLFTFMHWRRKWKPTPVFLPGESHAQRSLVGCHIWGNTESDTNWSDLAAAAAAAADGTRCHDLCFLNVDF